MSTLQIESRAARYNIVVERYATYEMTLRWKTGGDSPVPVPMDGAQALLQVRATTGETDALFEASTKNGKLTLHPTSGLISMFVTDAAFADLTFDTANYDLLVKLKNGRVYRIMEGTWSIVDGVSRFV